MNRVFERKQSPIHGIGIFALTNITKGQKICTGHYFHKKVWHRSKDIGFFNYSEKPNAITPYRDILFKNGKGSITEVIALRSIKEGEEITLRYTWYDPTKPDTEDNKHYKPLPDNVYFKSDRLYASEDIEIFNEFGITHQYIDYLDKYLANPLGGFLTKDKSPNCVLVKTKDQKHLLAIKSIKKDTLLTISNYE